MRIQSVTFEKNTDKNDTLTRLNNFCSILVAKLKMNANTLQQVHFYLFHVLQRHISENSMVTKHCWV